MNWTSSPSIDAAAERLLERELERSAAWLLAEEGRVADRQHYVTVHAEDGQAIGMAACYLVPRAGTHRAYQPTEVLLGARAEQLARRDELERLAALRSVAADRCGDTLVVVAPGTATASGVVLACDQGKAIAETLARAVESVARSWGATHVEFAHLQATGQDRWIAEVLAARGYADALVGANAVLDVTFPSLDAYFAGFTANRRKVLRKERRRYLDEGHRVSAGTGLTDDLVPLQLERYLRYGFEADAHAVRDRFARARTIPGLHVVRADGQDGPAGFVACYHDRHRARLVPRLGAFGGDRSGVYFNLAFYELISHAIEIGARSIHYGTHSYEAKTHRGCRLERLHTRILALDGDQDWVEDAAALRGGLEESELARHQNGDQGA
ncbi:hypothetical protein Aple_033980 [Acrocarpospora pleiomorpha]|uniref:BioF2-like acetyltransferase domain-containing protein n=1 Tax=Acrocarpospora pleiomorpha TaxID=90975 RepID=A0A5M3XIA3_9ACTN|nr:peptidogalycan biosysnthesis protein [Acrocarpospora pleiomorpha]GES20502.1 hypothetical protein Aple_033980 [Acrocarpospora pleiomorpha]